MNLINSVIPSEVTRKNVRAMIPVLVYWAKKGQTEHTYGDLAIAIDNPKYHRLGKPLAWLQNVIDALSESSSRTIPTLNSLVRNKKKGIPSDGFSFVSKKYTKLDESGKRIFVDGLNSRACAYKHWDWVLSKLGLLPYEPFTEKELDGIKILTGKFRGGEGKEHKELKEYICTHPEAIDLKKVVKAETEHLLPSGDKLDVYFELVDGTHVAVEVKPSTSDDSDITRGIFQCVKYKAIMDALQLVTHTDYAIKIIYLTVRPLSSVHYRLTTALSINHMLFQKFEIISKYVK